MTDHYVPGTNAHIDTSDFTVEIDALAGDASGNELMGMGLEESIYQLLTKRLSDYPKEPPSNAIVGRYFTMEKFLWFLHSKAIHFGSVNAFDDPHDCAVPQDYANAVSKFYFDRQCPPLLWDAHVDKIRSSWLISCWTEVTTNFDNYLIWHRYAGGPNGVAITANYKELKEALMPGLYQQQDSLGEINNLSSGYVSYGTPLRILPYNKRQMFQNEKEVRFTGASDIIASCNVSIESIFPNLGIRLSPDASQVHQDSVIDTWRRFGGSDNIVVADG